MNNSNNKLRVVTEFTFMQGVKSKWFKLSLFAGIIVIVVSLLYAKYSLAGFYNNESGMEITQGISLNDEDMDVSENAEEEEDLSAYVIMLIYILAIYMILLMYGSLISNAVIEEKSSRIMETLLCYCPPRTLVFGKILGYMLLATVHSMVWAIGGVVAGKLVGVDDILAEVRFKDLFSCETLICFIICFLSGFLMYAITYAAFASYADSTQDSIQLIIPSTLLLITSFILAIKFLEKSFTVITMILLCVPYLSPIFLLSQIISGNLSLKLIFISLCFQILDIIIITHFSAKAYKKGVYHYGAGLFKKSNRR